MYRVCWWRVVLPLRGDYLTPYVIADIGWSTISNVGGEQQYHYQEGRLSPKFIGTKTRKELGDGYAIIAKLESGYFLEDLKNIGRETFSWQMFAGIGSNYGQLTADKQWDFMFETLAVDRWGDKLGNVALMQLQAGPFNLGLPTGSIDYNRIAARFPMPKEIKYVSSSFSGLSLGAMHGEGEPEGQFSYGKPRAKASNTSRRRSG